MSKRKPFNLSAVPKAVREAEAETQSFRVAANFNEEDDVAELLIMDVIGETWLDEGVSGESVVEFLKEHADKEVHVRINSPGGLVYDSFVIFNALARHSQTVTVTIEGWAFSGASVIAMAGDQVRMHKASDFGIHRAAVIAIGNQKEMASMVEWLNTIDEHLIDIYSDRTGQSRDQIEKWLDGTSDGTLFSATEAKEAGFADEVLEPTKAVKEKAEDIKRAAVNGCAKRLAARNRLRMQSLKN